MWSKFQKKRYSKIILNPTTPLGRAVKMIKKLGKKKKPWAYNLLLELEKTVKNESTKHDEIIRAISKRGDQCAFDYIKNILNDNPDYPTKMSCYHSLKYFKNDYENRPEIISILLQGLSCWDKGWGRKEIASILELMNWNPKTKREEVKFLLAKGELNGINALDKDGVIALFEEMESKWNSMSDYDSRKDLFLKILKKVANKDTLPNLWHLTQIGSKLIAVDVFRLIMSIDDPQIGEYIALACKDKNKLLVREALRTIRGSRRHYYRKKYFSVVEQLCKDESHYREALGAFSSLAKLEDKDSVIRLIPSCNNLTEQNKLSAQDEYTVGTVFRLIRKFGAQHFVNELTELLNHPRSEVRRRAVHYLRDAGCKEAAGKIVNSLKNPDIDINERWEALGYFEQYPDRCAYETLCEIFKMHKDIMAAKAIANFPSAQTAKLLWSAMENINVGGDKKQQEKWINEGAQSFSNLLDNVIQSIADSVPKEVLDGILQLPQKISCVRESWDSDDYNTRVYRTEVTVDFSALKKHALEIYDSYHLY
jgi:hypothetical protein